MLCCSRMQTFHCKVVLLDEQELILEIKETCLGQEVLDSVYRHLNLLETSYFGLRYVDKGNQTHWLDTCKRVTKQLKGKEVFTLYFGVKFYAADPCKLLEETTRYQFFLQLKQDIFKGRLPASFDLAVELGSYIVQSELGDYDPHRHIAGYVSEFRIVSNQTLDIENKIEEMHKELIGLLPSVAELNYLEKVKWLDMYGVDLHPVLGEDNVEYFLGLTPTGVIVLRNKNKVANYTWSRITKIFNKGKYFMLRINDKNHEENTYGFQTPSKSACKHLYNCCMEHNAFFKLVQVAPNPPDLIGTSGPREKLRDSQHRLKRGSQINRNPSKKLLKRNLFEEDCVTKGQSDAENCIQDDVNKTLEYTCPPQRVRSESPRSVRSAPPMRGLFTSPTSPRSVHSARHSGTHAVESPSSNDSRSVHRNRYQAKRRGSDNESEGSKCSGKSRRRRNRSRRISSRHGSSHSHGRSNDVDPSSAHRDSTETLTKSKNSSLSKYSLGSVEEIDRSSKKSRGKSHRRLKHRSRSQSPISGKSRLPEEVKQHLEFNLIETDGMSEKQLREIPYKAVEGRQNIKGVSPVTKRKTLSMKKMKSLTSNQSCRISGDSPPPPYSDINQSHQSTERRKDQDLLLRGTSSIETLYRKGGLESSKDSLSLRLNDGELDKKSAADNNDSNRSQERRPFIKYVHNDNHEEYYAKKGFSNVPHSQSLYLKNESSKKKDHVDSKIYSPNNKPSELGPLIYHHKKGSASTHDQTKGESSKKSHSKKSRTNHEMRTEL